jgi:hydrogenase expression/formation protein HypC
VGLSSPGQVVSLESDQIGIVDVGGVRIRVRLGLLTSGGTRIGIGDWLLVQLGLAVAALDAAEASELTQLIAVTNPAVTNPAVTHPAVTHPGTSIPASTIPAALAA